MSLADKAVWVNEKGRLTCPYVNCDSISRNPIEHKDLWIKLSDVAEAVGKLKKRIAEMVAIEDISSKPFDEKIDSVFGRLK